MIPGCVGKNGAVLSVNLRPSEAVYFKNLIDFKTLGSQQQRWLFSEVTDVMSPKLHFAFFSVLYYFMEIN